MFVASFNQKLEGRGKDVRAHRQSGQKSDQNERYYFLDKFEKDESDSIKLRIRYVRKTISRIFCANCN